MESHRHALKQINAALLQPSKWLASYEDLVTKNVNTVGQIESALRSLTYIIPGGYSSSPARLGLETDVCYSAGRFRESDLPSECGKIGSPERRKD